MNLRRIAFSNLRRRRSRAGFLVGGLLIGVATVVALLALTAALTRQAQDNLESYGANILITPRADDLALSYGGVSVGAVTVGRRDLREADLQRLQGIKNARNIATVAPKLLGAVTVKGHKVLLMGVRPQDELAVKRWWSVNGRLLQADDELVVGSAVARTLRLQMGDRVTLAGRDFTVTGILAETGSQDDDLLISTLPAAQSLLHKPGRVSLVEVAALCAGCPIEDMVRQISGVMPGAKVTAMQQVVKSRMHALDQFSAFGAALAGIVIGIEMLVVFITMMGSVNERTREIGIFRALGFRRGHVVRLILIEAVTASAAAGVLGYLAGMGAAYGVLPFVSEGVRNAHLSWTPLLAGVAVGLAVVIGGVASLYPALHASRLDPSDALRAL